MQDVASERTRAAALAPDFLLRTVVLALLWWLLTHGETGSWTIGVPTIAAAAALSTVLMPTPPSLPRLVNLPKFLIYFLGESIVGGVDVVKRALHPDMPLATDFVTVTLSRLDPPQRLVFAILVSLMPGTLSARLEGETLLVHVLDRRLPIEASLDRLELALAALQRRSPDEGGER